MQFIESSDSELTDDSDNVSHPIDYRGFRRRYYESETRYQKKNERYYGHDDQVPDEHPLSLAKSRLRGARRSLCDELRDHPGRFAHNRPYALRMLGVPPVLDVAPTWWKSLLCGLMGAFVPDRALFWLLRVYVARVRTYEGRRFLTRGSLRWLLPSKEYSRALDFVVRRVRGTVSTQARQHLQSKSVRYLMALYGLGCVTATDLVRETRDLMDPETRELLILLCQSRTLVSVDELKSWPGLKNPGHLFQSGTREPEERFARSASAVLRQLVALRVERSAILAAFQDHGQFAPGRLSQTVFELRRRDVDAAAVFHVAGHLLWTAPTENWRFVLDELHLRTPSDFALFDKLLASRGDLPVELARALVAYGASVSELAACQSVLLRAGSLNAPGEAVLVWEELNKPPFNFTPGDFGAVREFLRQPEQLSAFLRELDRRGLVEPTEVLVFDKCIGPVDAVSLGTLLDIALPRQGGESLAAVADWVRRACLVGSNPAWAMLVEVLNIPTLFDLERSLKLMPIGADVLRYLVVDKGIGSLGALLRWFHERAVGILDMKFIGRIGPIERLLLDDAFERGNFASVSHNLSCAYAASRRRATANLGKQPRYDEADARAAYNERFEATRELQRPALLKDMARLLASTSGVLFESFLSEVDADEAKFEARMASLSPLIDELIAGRGPSAAVPSEVDLEAVALVYGVDLSNVQAHWPDVVGREPDIAALNLDSSYLMRWQRSRRELRADAKLDDRGFSALSKVSAMAEQFRQLADSDMEKARARLRPSRIEDDAADVPGLAFHLAILCSLLTPDANVRAMLLRWNSAHGAIGGGPAALQLIEQTQSFFSTALPDAIKEHLDARLKLMSDQAARLLAERLAPTTVQLSCLPAREHLAECLDSVCSKLQRVFGAWAKKQDDKFASTEDENAATELVAVVSKAPAAFFAKYAAALCTKSDTDMWNEDRHSHLVVFDPVRRRLAGMAMLYVETVAAIEARRRSLIIRAINPTAAMASEHAPGSVVDACLALAIEIARANDLAAVAIPGTDSHQLSNVHAVEADMVARYIHPSTTFRGSLCETRADGTLARPWQVDTTFDGYARGSGRVSSLHVIWLSARAISGSDNGH